MIIEPVKKLKGEITVPGDKSISHRAVMFGAISEGLTEISHFLSGADCLSTISCFRKMGIEIRQENEHVLVYGKGLHGLKESPSILDTGNSGTTTRLICGILSGQKFTSILNGDESLQKRPMKRVISPLSEMGASIRSIRENGCVPLQIDKSSLYGISYASPVASAQVKSCILLAGMYADTPTSVTEPLLSRNHTELMLKGFGADITSAGKTATIMPEPLLSGQKIEVPGDISSAAYFIAAGLIVPDSEVYIKNVGINPTRDGIIKAALAMGAAIEKINIHEVSGEPVCDLLVKSSPLHGATIEGDIIPTLIDEIPVIAVMAACATGDTVIKDAAELKVKESDRIQSVVSNLNAIGIAADPADDGMIIHGGIIKGGHVNSLKDHRIAMAFAVAGLVSKAPIDIKDADCVDISYPGFYQDLLGLRN